MPKAGGTSSQTPTGSKGGHKRFNVNEATGQKSSSPHKLWQKSAASHFALTELKVNSPNTFPSLTRPHSFSLFSLSLVSFVPRHFHAGNTITLTKKSAKTELF